MRISATPHETNSDLGFTLIELLVVLVILSMVYAILPRYIARQDKSFQLSRMSQQLVSDLKGLRQWSILSGTPAEFKINMEHHAYDLNTDIDKRRIFQDDYQIFIQNSSAEGNSALPYIAFFPDGRNSGGEIEIKANGQVKIVSADPFSGSVTLEDSRR